MIFLFIYCTACWYLSLHSLSSLLTISICLHLFQYFICKSLKLRSSIIVRCLSIFSAQFLCIYSTSNSLFQLSSLFSNYLSCYWYLHWRRSYCSSFCLAIFMHILERAWILTGSSQISRVSFFCRICSYPSSWCIWLLRSSFFVFQVILSCLLADSYFNSYLLRSFSYLFSISKLEIYYCLILFCSCVYLYSNFCRPSRRTIFDSQLICCLIRIASMSLTKGQGKSMDEVHRDCCSTFQDYFSSQLYSRSVSVEQFMWDRQIRLYIVILLVYKAVIMMSSTRVRSNTRISRKGQIKTKCTPLDQIMQINQQYSQLMKQLARVTFADPKMSERARLIETVQLLRQIKICLRKQSNNYDKVSSNRLADFIQRKQLGNAGNLIGKYEQLKDEIESCKKQLEEAEQVSKEMEQPDLEEMEMHLQKELQQATRRRILVQNRQEMIRQQLQICAGEVKQGRGRLLDDQLKLRGLQTGKLK